MGSSPPGFLVPTLHQLSCYHLHLGELHRSDQAVLRSHGGGASSSGTLMDKNETKGIQTQPGQPQDCITPRMEGKTNMRASLPFMLELCGLEPWSSSALK